MSQTEVPSPVQIKIIDFDTVEQVDEAGPKPAKYVLGTDQYIAPEAYAGLYTPASDIFAVGVLGFRLLTGRFPYNRAIFDDEPGENWVGSPKMREIRGKLSNSRVEFDHAVFRSEPMAQDFIGSLLSNDQSSRPTAKEAMAHPWIRSVLEETTTKTAEPNRRLESLPFCWP